FFNCDNEINEQDHTNAKICHVTIVKMQREPEEMHHDVVGYTLPSPGSRARTREYSLAHSAKHLRIELTPVSSDFTDLKNSEGGAEELEQPQFACA
ncbi:Hypothetical predicted protein, partial [Paramuricea clavata]